MNDEELMRRVLDLLPDAIDLQQSELDDHILKYGEWYRPKRVEYMKSYLNALLQAKEALEARLSRSSRITEALAELQADGTLSPAEHRRLLNRPWHDKASY